MKQFASHIDFLIQRHDCVIIPDFGGFVLSREVASIAADGAITPPRVVVGFNPDLKYNDGLLAESYMNVYSISYDIACKRIDDTVNRLNTILALRQSIQIGHLGKLGLDAENHLCFTPNQNLSFHYPDTYGLSVLNMRRLTDIAEVREMSVVINNRRSVYQRIFTGIGAAAAAVLVFFVTSTPVLENTNPNVQKSGFFTDVMSSSSVREAKINAMLPIEVANEELRSSLDQENVSDVIPAEVKETVPVSELEATMKATSAVETKKEIVKETIYYIIIGSAGNKSEAQAILRKFHSQGYKTAEVINSSERARISVATFDDKAKAEKYLSTFRSNNPKLNDAWVYTKRN